MGSPQQSLSPARPSHQQNLQDKTDEMEDNLAATFDAGNSFNSKLRDTLQGLLAANNERKSEIDALRGDHDQLKSDHEALVNTTERTASGRMRSSLWRRGPRRTTRPESPTSLSWTASSTLRTTPGRRRSRAWTAGPSQKMILARRRLRI